MGIEYPAAEEALYGQVTLDKYNALVAKLKADKDASNLTVDGFTGKVTYQKIDFSWTYGPDSQELLLQILSNHNWRAKIAGNRTIFEMVNDELVNPKQ